MKIAVASGKGGTGKTTISTNLALAVSEIYENTQYVDCDVEEPNGHIFLKPEVYKEFESTVLVPQVITDRCTGCGKCAELCQYNSIICIKGKAVVFEELCHSCGGCELICPEKCITEIDRRVGAGEIGKSANLTYIGGTLDIGTIQSPAMIKSVKKKSSADGIVIVDAPPGTSCPVIEAIGDADFVLLVTEPTPFGLNDLILAVDMVKQLQLPFAVAINRSDIGDEGVENYCKENDIEVMLRIVNDRKIAECYSVGEMVIEKMPQYKQQFIAMFNAIKEVIGK